MSSFTVDVAYKSINKFSEILCGDRVEIIHTADSDIMILADGMGSGVKANILSTLTSKIIGTMFSNGATLEECVETIAETLPICQVRQVAYATFSIVQIKHSGEAYVVEFDNPGCIFIRDGVLMEIPQNRRRVAGKDINEYRFEARKNDTLIIMSDGTVHAGVGALLNFGWLWEDIAAYALRQSKKTRSAMRLATDIVQACDELYNFRPGDDTTVAVMRVIDKRSVHIMTGPPQKKEDDAQIVADFMSDPYARTIVCGGTSATILSRELNRPMEVSIDYFDPDVPPTAKMAGIDLVTEGVLTLSKALQLIRRYIKNEAISPEFFDELDQPNGAAQVAKVLIEECTECHMFVGKAVNEAYQNPNIPFDLGIRQNLVEQLKHAIEDMGKPCYITYY